mmetsp:Transcript_75009/g.160658  ORF Transcript_75009/g.160658 Transcript_75009/m.160658 type:complete len:713 (-) Transcript_75009:78-2216(-)
MADQAKLDALARAQNSGSRDDVLACLSDLIELYASQKPVDPLAMLQVAKDGVLFFKDKGDKHGTAGALHLVAQVQYRTSTRRDEPKEAKRAAAAAIAFYKDLGDQSGEVAVLNTVITASLAKERVEQAFQASQELLALCKATGDRAGEAVALERMGDVFLKKENPWKAKESIDEALAIVAELGDTPKKLSIMTKLVGIYQSIDDVQSAMETTEEIMNVYRQNDDREGEASMLMMMYRNSLAMGAIEQAFNAAFDAANALRDLGETKQRLEVLDFLSQTCVDGGQKEEAVTFAKEQHALAKLLENRLSEGKAMWTFGKCMLKGPEGLGCIKEAVTIFESIGAKSNQAQACQTLANGILLNRGDAEEALEAAMQGMAIYKELGDKPGQAIMQHTIANCKVAARDNEEGVNSAYEALAMFEDLRDKYGMDLATKLLRGAGQSKEEIRERRSTTWAKFETVDGGDGAGAGDGDDMMKQLRDDAARDLQDERMLWEHAWVPIQTEDPGVKFGDKFTGTKRVFIAGNLKDTGLLSKLAAVTPEKAAAKGPTYLTNTLHGRLQTSEGLQTGMIASACRSVIYDMSNNNNMPALEGIDCVIRVLQAQTQIDDGKVPIDIITSSTHAHAYSKGLREPFHGGFWGVGRAVNIEMPQIEIRVMDLDSGERWGQWPYVCRFLLGSQTSRPVETVCRGGQFKVNRLVGSRTRLLFPYRVEVETNI